MIEIYKNFVDQFINKLKVYKLRSKVEINYLPNYKILWSPQPYSKSNTIHLVNGHVVISHIDPRANGLGYRTVINTTDLTENNSQYIQHINLANSAYNLQRYHLAVPEFSELTQEKSFPLEYGFDKLNAIDFDKGCYVGQELIARTFHRGVIRKNIFKVEAKIDFITIFNLTMHATPDESFNKTQNEVFDELLTTAENSMHLYVNNLIIGKILSYHNNIAIAQIRIEELAVAQLKQQPITVNGHVVYITVPLWRQ